MPYPWQMSFQQPCSPFMDKLDILHNYIMNFLFVVIMFVLVWLSFLLLRFIFCSFTRLVNSRIIQIQHNSLLEFIWTVVPFMILSVIFSSSAALIYDGANKASILETISVVGNQWYWNYRYLYLTTEDRWFREPKFEEYDSYMVTTADYLDGVPGTNYGEYMLYPYRLLLVDEPLIFAAYEWIRFLISSRDVIHSWALPAAGIKCDAIPGRINEVISAIVVPGEYFGQCSELCGINHGFMPIHIYAYGHNGIY